MSTRGAGLFVTGTDTGVGKTRVSRVLLAAARARGLDLGAMKPIETGVDGRGPLDAIALREAAGVEDALDVICPQRFALPAAPCVAAAAEGRGVELDVVMRCYAELAARHVAMLVEGAGGLLVPTTPEADMGDLAAALGLPVLIVARATLGTINHTRLTLAECVRRNLPVVGVVLSHAGGPTSEPDEANLAYLRGWLGVRLLGELPHRAAPGRAELEEDARTIDLDRIFATLG